MTKRQLEELLKDMSLQEKIDQMVQLPAGVLMKNGREIITGPLSDLHITQEELDGLGSILGTYDPDELNRIQKEQMERQPHHIPMLFMLDVIHGMKTVYPSPLGQGATFDPDLVRDCASMAAKEASLLGVHVTFSPMADLCRDARWGRVMEGTGEDPYLNGRMTAAMVEGYQGHDMQEPYKICACVKHFAGYGAPTAGRDYTAAQLSRHTFLEYYLSGYRAGIRAGAGMVMTSFNTVEDIPATGNQTLMRDVLRGELGFKGVLISDYGAVKELIAHGYASDKDDAAAKALTAGVDIDMVSDCYCDHLAEQIRSGKISESLLNEAVMRILELKNKLGLFEHPYRYADKKEAERFILSDDNRKLARRAAQESIVLLKNEDDILPLYGGVRVSKSGENQDYTERQNIRNKLALIGPYADSRSLLSSWAVAGEQKDVVTIREALEECGAGTLLTAKGCPMIGRDEICYNCESRETDSLSDQELCEMEEEALRAAREADQVILCVGEHFLQSGESASRTELLIPAVQQDLMRKVAQVNSNLITVVVTGRPLDLREVVKLSKAVLIAWFPGTEGGHAVADILTGATSPQGKLPMSFPYCTGQEPISYNAFSSGRPMPEGKHLRFFSGYSDAPNEPLYPFGYGLTYTDFSLTDPTLDRDVMSQEDKITASAVLTNIGKRSGTETVQLYIRDLSASVVRPVRELKGFQKVKLEAGQSCRVSFPIDISMLEFLRADGTFGAEKGKFQVFISRSSAEGRPAEFTLQ